jgi:tyrosyl-tRNA synthetase
MTFHLLIGTDGKKMSKSAPNCILIDDTPFDMYQKLMNVRDDLILHYFELATDMDLDEVEAVKKRLEAGEHPNLIKEELAQRIITLYHGKPYDPKDVTNLESVHVGVEKMLLGELLKHI